MKKKYSTSLQSYREAVKEKKNTTTIYLTESIELIHIKTANSGVFWRKLLTYFCPKTYNINIDFLKQLFLFQEMRM